MRAKTIDKVYFGNYHKRAEEFYKAMNEAVVFERYNASALLGIHASIALMDSLLLYEKGKRAAEEDHRQSVRMLEKMCGDKKLGDMSGTRRFGEIIAKKNQIAYSEHYRADDDTVLSDIRLNVERCFNWAYRNFEQWNNALTKDAQHGNL